MRLRIFSELLPYETVSSRRVLNLLRGYQIELIVAVTPSLAHQVGEVVRTAGRQGVRVSLWPMLSREEGRWLNVSTAKTFISFVKNIYETSRHEGWPLVEVLFDLEPTFAEMVLAIDSPMAARHFVKALDENRAQLRSVTQDFHSLCSMLRDSDVTLATALVPMVATARDPSTWRELLGVPAEPAHATHGVMLYTSLLEGWSRGLVSRRTAMGLLRCGTEAALARWGKHAEIAVGLVGPGIFGHEPSYRRPDELAADVALVRGAGAKSLALFDLGGVLSREPAEAWLEALFVTPDRHFAPGRRARALWETLEHTPVVANSLATFFRSRT